MAKKLHISGELSLPVEAVTEVIGFLGRRGQGKSYAALKLAEEMHKAAAQFVSMDPVGTWWGLRLSGNGKRPGIPVPVFGGLHGDVPLEPTAGKLIADLVADRGISVVLDVSQFESDADRTRFAHDFGARFFFRRKQAPAAVHLFLEEAQEFVPQNPQKEETRMLHVYQRIAKLGRNYGIGVSIISQRPQEVHKKVLNLSELLFVFQLTGSHERKAVETWIRDKDIDEDIAGELPKLVRGKPHVWSPAWLQISEVVPIAGRWTFDASATPKVGKAAAQQLLSPIDLEQLRDDMAATIERAKAEDPKELRRKIAMLEKELRTSVAQAPPAVQVVEVPVFRDGELDDLRRMAGTVAGHTTALQSLMGDLTAVSEKVSIAIERGGRLHAGADSVKLHTRPAPKTPARRVVAPSAPGPQGLRSTKPQQRILDALAWLEAVGIGEPQTVAVAFIAGYKPGGGAFQNPRSRLHQAGLIEYQSGGRLSLTAQGRAMARAPARPGTIADLHEMVLARLNTPQRRILQPLLDHYPEPLEQDQLAELAGYSPGGGAFQNPRSSLRTLGLIDYPSPGLVVAEPLLFLEP